MSAYVIFDVEIRDMSRYQEFMTAVKPAIASAGGRYLVRGGEHKDRKSTRLNSSHG